MQRSRVPIPAMTIYINGKFVAQATTGVQRVAMCLVRALDSQAGRNWVLLCPPSGERPPLLNIRTRTIGPAGLPLHLWEQVVLPLAARDGLLINLAGSAPAMARRQVGVLHDAAVFDCPRSYSRPFVLWYRWLFRRLARRAERLLTVSGFSRSRLALHLGLAPDRIAIVPGGSDHLDGIRLDANTLGRHGIGDGRFLMAVASANPSKNLPALMAAFASLGPEPGVRLVIVGGRNPRVFADPSGIDPPGVVRTGPIDDAQLKALYERAVALVFPSLYEGFGLPPIEAMACGCPVAAAGVASIPEVCGDAALYFDPSSVSEIAQAMRRLLDDVALRDRLRSAGRERAALYQWRKSAAILLAALPAGGGR